MQKFLKKFLSVMLVLVLMMCVMPIDQSAYAAEHNIPDGFYTIYSSLGNNKVADLQNRSTVNGSNIQLYEANASVAQIYYICHVRDGYYKIVLAGAQNKAFDIHGGTAYSGANVEIYDYHGGDNQLWEFIPTGNPGEYYIVSKSGGFYLDVSGAGTSNGTNIQVYKGNKSKAQRWVLKENYNVSKAITYAQKWTDNSGTAEGHYNSGEYNRYTEKTGLIEQIFGYFQGNNGYDCTNFVSQCLYDGGMITTSNWGRVAKGMKPDDVQGGLTWVRARALYPYLQDLGYPTEEVRSDLSNIHLGDIVFFDSNGDGIAGHATICTDVSGGIPKYCAHSNWRRNFAYDSSGWYGETGGKAYVVHMSFCTQTSPQMNTPSKQTGTSSDYYPACNSSHTSIINALKSVGVDSSYAFRKKIAVANNIANYSGTSSQNIQMLSLLKSGRLLRPDAAADPATDTVNYFPKYSGSSNSLVTALRAVGADSTYRYRKQIAAVNGISGYSGTAAQNILMLSKLKAGNLKKP